MAMRAPAETIFKPLSMRFSREIFPRNTPRMKRTRMVMVIEAYREKVKDNRPSRHRRKGEIAVKATTTGETPSITASQTMVAREAL